MKPILNPYYGATGCAALKAFWKNAFNFTGRSTRSEFWWGFVAYLLTLFNVIVISALFVVIEVMYDPNLGLPILPRLQEFGNIPGFWLIWLIAFPVLLIPYLAVMARRFRDAGIHWVIVWGLTLLNIGILFPIKIAQELGVSLTWLPQGFNVIVLSHTILVFKLLIEVLPSKPLPDN